MSVRSDAWFAILILGLVIVSTFKEEIRGAINRAGISQSTKPTTPITKQEP